MFYIYSAIYNRSIDCIVNAGDYWLTRLCQSYDYLDMNMDMKYNLYSENYLRSLSAVCH